MNRVAFVLAWALMLASLDARGAEDELYIASPAAVILGAAREIIRADPDGALITIDAEGQPRARTVTTRPPDADMTIWIATRPDTRKVAQIRNNARVTLYFNGPRSRSSSRKLPN